MMPVAKGSMTYGKPARTNCITSIRSRSKVVRIASKLGSMAKDNGQEENGKGKLKRKDYEKELRRLQAELCHLQAWVKHKGLRIMVVFEGRDGAGKGGTIRAIVERVSPRVFRLVALPAPSDRQKTQMHIQRYIQHFPAAGEIVIFDRSWYNRAGVEHVMGFCTTEQYEDFLETSQLPRGISRGPGSS